LRISLFGASSLTMKIPQAVSKSKGALGVRGKWYDSPHFFTAMSLTRISSISWFRAGLKSISLFMANSATVL